LGGADLRRGPLGVGWGYFIIIFIIKYCWGRGLGSVGSGARDLGSNRGYFIKIGGQLAGKEEEMWATIGNISWK
jgi:hypothetical protein